MAEETNAPAAPAAAAPATGDTAAAARKKGKKGKKSILNGVVHIQSTFNNTIITITDVSGNVISWNVRSRRSARE